MDDERIISNFSDENATRAWNRGDKGYFRRPLGDFEERDGPEVIYDREADVLRLLTGE